MATGALIRCVPNASLEALLPAVARLPDGDGGSARWMIGRPAIELRRVMRGGQRFRYPVPDTCPPVNEAIVASGVRAAAS